MTISEAFAIFDSHVLVSKSLKTRKNYRTTSRSITNALGEIPIEIVGQEQIIIWKNFMQQEGCTGTTQRGYLMDFRKVVRFFRSRGLQLIDPATIEMPANDTPPRVWLTPQEIGGLISSAKSERDKALLACTFLTGCRISEILNLDREDMGAPIDAQGIQEVTVCGKRGKYRPVFFNETARNYLNSYLETRSDRYRPLFISGQNRRLTVSRAEQIVHQCSRDAGLDKVVTPHTLRHSFATDLLLNHAPLYDVSKTMGHKNIATTANIYGHYDTQARKATLLNHQTNISNL